MAGVHLVLPEAALVSVEEPSGAVVEQELVLVGLVLAVEQELVLAEQGLEQELAELGQVLLLLAPVEQEQELGQGRLLALAEQVQVVLLEQVQEQPLVQEPGLELLQAQELELEPLLLAQGQVQVLELPLEQVQELAQEQVQEQEQEQV